MSCQKAPCDKSHTQSADWCGVVCSYIDDPADRELDVIAAFLDDVKDAEVPTHTLHRHIQSHVWKSADFP